MIETRTRRFVDHHMMPTPETDLTKRGGAVAVLHYALCSGSILAVELLLRKKVSSESHCRVRPVSRCDYCSFRLVRRVRLRCRVSARCNVRTPDISFDLTTTNHPTPVFPWYFELPAFVRDADVMDCDRRIRARDHLADPRRCTTLPWPPAVRCSRCCSGARRRSPLSQLVFGSGNMPCCS